MSAYEEIEKTETPTDLDLAVIFYGMDDPEDEDGNAAAQELLDLRAKADKVPALEARLAKAEELLRRLEWEGNWHPNYYTCPICACSRDDGKHADGCELDAFLKGIK